MCSTMPGCRSRRTRRTTGTSRSAEMPRSPSDVRTCALRATRDRKNEEAQARCVVLYAKMAISSQSWVCNTMPKSSLRYSCRRTVYSEIGGVGGAAVCGSHLPREEQVRKYQTATMPIACQVSGDRATSELAYVQPEMKRWEVRDQGLQKHVNECRPCRTSFASPRSLICPGLRIILATPQRPFRVASLHRYASDTPQRPLP